MSNVTEDLGELKMKSRLSSAAIILTVLVTVLLLSHTIVLNIVVSAISFIALYELLSATKIISKRQLCIPGFVFCAAIPFLPLFNAKMIYAVILFFIAALFIISIASKGNIKFSELSIVFFSSLFLALSFTSIVLIRRLDGGIYLISLLFLGAWCTDVFAYLIGRKFGKHKLAPFVSPKKSVEGAIAGIVFTVLIFIGFGIILMFMEQNVNVDFFMLTLAGLLISVVSQIGDLSTSTIKREYDIKDYGNLIPGHGGIMDRFDSILLAAPFLYLFLNFINFISF